MRLKKACLIGAILVLGGFLLSCKLRHAPLEFLTKGRDQIDMHPNLSPDGKVLAFTRFKQLMFMDMGTKRAEKVHLAGLHTFSHPEWSPDGKELVFSAFHEHSENPLISSVHLILMDAETEKWKCLTPEAGNSVRPIWSPKGDQILFTKVDRRETYLCVWDRRKGTIRRVGKVRGRAGAWSPKGDKIVFVKDGDLWLMDADGSNPKPLLEMPETYEDNPRWSPDGKFILFTTQKHLTDLPENRDLWAIRLSDRKTFALTECAPECWVLNFCFQPDGKAVLFALRMKDHSVLCRLTLDWGNLKPVKIR